MLKLLTKIRWIRLSPRHVWHRIAHPQLEVAICGANVSEVDGESDKVAAYIETTERICQNCMRTGCWEAMGRKFGE